MHARHDTPDNWLIYICLFISIFCASNLYGQESKDLNTKKDSISVKQKTFLEKMQAFAEKSAKDSEADFKADNISLVQLKVINDIRINTQNTKAFLKTPIDSIALTNHISNLQRIYDTASDGVFIRVGSIQTYRNLASTKRILRELLRSTSKIKSSLELRQKSLTSFHYKFDSLSTVPELFTFPKDSASVLNYVKILGTVAYETAPVDSVLKVRSLQIQKLINTYNLTINQLSNSIEQVEQYEQTMTQSSFDRELPDIWQHPKRFRSTMEILEFSAEKNLLTLKYYAINNFGRLVVILLLIFCSIFYLSSLKTIYINKGLFKKEMDGQLAINYPVFSAILIVLSLFQFILISPPFMLSLLIWLVSCICLTIVFRNFISSYWMKVWLLMVLLLMVSSFGNILLQASREERWFMLFVSIIGTVAGMVILVQKRYSELKEKWISYSIGFMVVIEVASAILNLYGRFNLSKTLFLVGFLNVVISILFLWVVRFINEGLLLAFDVYTVQDRKLFYLNFGKMGGKAPAILYVLLIVGWLVIIGHNFPQFDMLSKPLLDFLEIERRIGNYSFNINGLLLFLGIMTVSVIASKVVSFFTSDEHLAES
ncbi:MAG: mechanosensitive ion channel protein, partial [Chryseobacterium sp.]